LNDLKKENEAKRKFPLISESGEAIMDEEEFQAVRQLNKVRLTLVLAIVWFSSAFVVQFKPIIYLDYRLTLVQINAL